MNQLSLLAYLAHAAIASPRKKRSSGDYIFFGEYMACAQFLYELGAVLGYSYRRKLILFVELFTIPGSESSFVHEIATPAAHRLAERKSEPKDFIDLFFKPEAERLMTKMQVQYTDWSNFTMAAMEELKTEDIFPDLQMITAEAIGLGACYPELTERLFSYSPDQGSWRKARAYGVDIPVSPPSSKSLREREVDAIEMIKPYIQNFRPECLIKLGL